MKIGVCVSDYDIRNDLADLLRALAVRHEVVVLATPLEFPRVGEGPWEKRLVRTKISLWNRGWYWLYLQMGCVPASRDNFVQHALFLIEKMDPAQRPAAAAVVRRRVKLPQIFNFDMLLKLFHGKCAEIDDLDGIVFITNVASPELLAQALRQDVPTAAYVYSWDHAPKFDRFSRKVGRYLTWNAGIGEDLVELQGIARERTQAVGATQLVRIQEYLNSPELRRRKMPFRYVYYGCATGIPSIAEQECKLVEWLAEELAVVDAEIKLVVRPYPMLRDTTGFRRLRSRANVSFDDEYRSEVQERAMSRKDIFDKFNLQEHAEIFMHCGTTMGLEAAYFDAPILFLAPEDLEVGVPAKGDLHLTRFFNTSHNQKYLMPAGFPNVVRRAGELRGRLREVLANRVAHLDYNRAIRNSTPLRSMDEIVRDIAGSFAP